MATRSLDLKSMGQVAREAEEAAQRAPDRRHAPGPDLSREACVDCGAFGPWGDGEFFYCAEHVPNALRSGSTPPTK